MQEITFFSKYAFYQVIYRENMKFSLRNLTGLILIVFFSVIFVISFVIFPDMGEKILYGKHPPNKKSEPLQYTEIILSGNFNCMEIASIEAKGDLPKFVKEFNDCNS